MKSKKAWIFSVIMGLGHMRAAYPLKDIAYKNIIMDGTKEICDTQEYKVWNRMQKLYYFISKAEKIPLIGKYLFNLMITAQIIPHFYPKRDLSKPNWATHYLYNLIKKKNISSGLIKKIKEKNLPVINTYFASAIAIDEKYKHIKNNYLIVCDTDINRVWVPLYPKKSRIKYLAPCGSVKQRLLAYGVPEKNIFLTGFPLPKENIGSEKKMEILKQDLFQRLLRLDPNNKFFTFHKKSISPILKQPPPPKKRDNYFTLTLAIGGAGAQTDLAKIILKSLKDKMKNGKIKIYLSLGILNSVNKEFIHFLKHHGFTPYINQSIKIIYSQNINDYYEKFNQSLRTTDVLWTKPSELTFYCGLGIPILMAPTIGTHEERNRRWLSEIHANIEPVGKLEYINEWLFDLRDNGRLAEAAWDGFLKTRKLGTYQIERLITTGTLKSE